VHYDIYFEFEIYQAVRYNVQKNAGIMVFEEQQKMKHESQSAKATRRVLELSQIVGAKEEDEKGIDFFFYADELNDALDLMNHLKGLQYDVQCVPPVTT
jgi:hypothetical protein